MNWKSKYHQLSIMQDAQGIARDVASMRDFNKYMVNADSDVDVKDILVVSGAVGHALNEIGKMEKKLEKFATEFEKGV